MDEQQIINRWRLILGEFAGENLPLNPEDAEMDAALGFLYNREYGKDQGCVSKDNVGEGEPRC